MQLGNEFVSAHTRGSRRVGGEQDLQDEMSDSSPRWILWVFKVSVSFAWRPELRV